MSSMVAPIRNPHKKVREMSQEEYISYLEDLNLTYEDKISIRSAIIVLLIIVIALMV